VQAIKMARLIEFTTNHFWLVSAFCVVLGVLCWTMLQGTLSNALSPQQAVLLLNREDAVPIDIRSDANYRGGHIINAVHVEYAKLDAELSRLEKFKSRPLLVYCDSGVTSGQAVKRLRRAGFGDVRHLAGGITAWRNDNLPLEGKK
jgi:rhodanese-related sulfurtransferase